MYLLEEETQQPSHRASFFLRRSLCERFLAATASGLGCGSCRAESAYWVDGIAVVGAEKRSCHALHDMTIHDFICMISCLHLYDRKTKRMIDLITMKTNETLGAQCNNILPQQQIAAPTNREQVKISKVLNDIHCLKSTHCGKTKGILH